jgi:hypothetical protein
MASVVRELVQLVGGATKAAESRTPTKAVASAAAAARPALAPRKTSASAARQIPLDDSEGRGDFSDFSKAA